ncbi:MAG TPA: hypothetical protein GX507_10235 [Clostridia bacterium]|nr:hypothetical protein [Clostridia bacterium]
MKSNTSKLAELIRVAEMYYVFGMSQEDIAREISISRSMVSRMLDKARREGLVEIRIANPFAYQEFLGHEISGKYNIKEAVVISSNGNERNLAKLVGIGAAKYIEDNVLPGARAVGVGWGETLYEMIAALGKCGPFTIEVVPLIGGMDGLTPDHQVNSLCRRFAEAVGGKNYILHAPALVSSPEVKEGLCESNDMKMIMEKWQCLDTAIVEIYPLSASLPALPMHCFDENQVLRLMKAKTVGDVCCNFFDASGRESYGEIAPRRIGIDFDSLKRIPSVVAVAVGEGRAEAVAGALRAGLVDVLIVDEVLARAIVSGPKVAERGRAKEA